ncbi:hypothetical protein K0M31_002138 [Melipona bicolor]|uniref:Uncharacterized protein n=1 Tax=Melipona bicolor TaxID=60889 RepID=A0AA40GH06_9HYME|nr:hypothetical protein K0M31_002138 [Melipona bicolor]
MKALAKAIKRVDEFHEVDMLAKCTYSTRIIWKMMAIMFSNSTSQNSDSSTRFPMFRTEFSDEKQTTNLTEFNFFLDTGFNLTKKFLERAEVIDPANNFGVGHSKNLSDSLDED